MPHPIIDGDLPDNEILARIGTVTAEWQWLESLMAEFLSKICQADPGSMYVITQKAGAANLVSWIKTLVEVRFDPPDFRKVILDLFEEIDTARLERNTVVHGLWYKGHEPGFGLTQTVSWTRAEVAKDEVWTLGDLDELIDEIKTLQGGLGNLMLRLGFPQHVK